MDSSRWDRIQSVFHGAADLPKLQQRAFLESACAGDISLIADVQALLDEDAKDSSLLNRNMADIASEVLDDPASHRFPFKEFGPYRIVRVLGEGGMGVVFLAERRDLHSQVAIKILRDAWVSPARRDRFSSEQRTLAQLNHPSIARLYDADCLPDGTPWFAMEYVEGLPLLDFGIAKQLDPLDAPSDRTRTGLQLMTPAYAAPEQIRGERVGIYTDVYSLGVVLYELLAGQLPFDLSDRTPGESERIILEQEPEKP